MSRDGKAIALCSGKGKVRSLLFFASENFERGIAPPFNLSEISQLNRQDIFALPEATGEAESASS